jgi:two-component system, chemotaxis family, sensor kinase CheA
MTLEQLSWEERARAAERTAEVLKRRLRAIDAGEEKTVIQRQLESAQRRALDVERRRALMELKSAELERYSARLEAEVAVRTEQIRMMVDHVGSGFLMFARDGRAEPGASRACTRLLGAEPAEQLLPDLLGWPEARRVAFALSVDQVFDDLLPEEVSLHEVPSRATVGGRELAVSYSVVRKDGAVHRVLATITDVTAQVEAERAAHHHARLVRILAHREAFLLFLTDARRLLRESAAAHPETDCAFIRRSVHTVKGNAAIFGLHEVSDACHAIEEELVIDHTHITRVADALRGFLEQNRPVLQIDPDPERTASRAYVVSQSIFDKLSDQARKPDTDQMAHLLQRLRQRPANDFLDPIHAAVQSLAERLDKRVSFVVHGGEVGVDPDRLAPLLRVLPHLVRNAIDHGLEAPEERGDKPAQGRLELSFTDAGDHWTLTLRDDGRGVDAARVIETAQRRGILTAEQAKRVPASSVLDVLTLEGFSTADTVTDVSGRGVGLSAVREAVESLGGSMRLDSEPGRGTTFTMVVPKQLGAVAV